VSATIELSRQQWQEGYQRFQTLAKSSGGDRLYRELETISDELRRRIGQTFTLAEAVELYGSAERWGADAMAERAAVRGWSRDLAIVLDAAFYLYTRAAVDYLP
jgi:Ca2+-binding EF-hand superfamily protein